MKLWHSKLRIAVFVTFLALAFWFLVPACSPILSRPGVSVQLGQAAGKGLSYSLPKGLLRLQVVRVPVVTDSPAVSERRLVDPSKRNQLSQRPSGVDLIKVSSDDNTEFKQQNDIVSAEKSVAPATTRVLRLQGNVRLVPDPSQQYTMYYLGSVLADEDINVKVNKEGLLSQVNVTTEDKTGAIAIKLIEVGKEVVKFLATAEPAAELIEYDVEFDPCTELVRINRELGQRFPQDNLSVRLIRSSYNESGYGEAFIPGESKRFSGAAFRPVRPYAVLLRKQGKVTTSHQIFLPNESHVYYYPVTRAAFVKKVTTLNFDEGILTDVKVTKPSEALAFMEIPLALVKAIASLPGEIIDNSIALIDKRKNLATSQTNLLTEQEKLEAEQQKIRDQMLKKKQSGANPSNPPPGGESGSNNPTPDGGSDSNPD